MEAQFRPTESSTVMLEHVLTRCRGAYCAAVIISLLNLPLELPPSSPAWSPGATFLTNLPEWIARCKSIPEKQLSQTPLTT